MISKDLILFLQKSDINDIVSINNGTQILIMVYTYRNLLLHKFMIVKMQELFEDVAIKQIEHFSIKSSVEYYFNDNISNPINKNKEFFSQLLDGVLPKIFKTSNNEEEQYGVINYKKCRAIIEEIKAEQEFQNQNFFEL